MIDYTYRQKLKGDEAAAARRREKIETKVSMQLPSSQTHSLKISSRKSGGSTESLCFSRWLLEAARDHPIAPTPSRFLGRCSDGDTAVDRFTQTFGAT